MVCSSPLVWIGWGYWNRNRPDLIADGVAASGLHSFPSGHIVVVITVYGLLTYLWCRASPSQMERAIIVLTMTLWIGLITSSRLVLGAHWPSDIIARNCDWCNVAGGGYCCGSPS